MAFWSLELFSLHKTEIIPVFDNSLGRFIVITLFSYVTKCESLKAKIGK
jgi:hypothetical protein